MDDDDWLASRLFEWWLDRPAWIRVGVGLAFVALGVVLGVQMIWPAPDTPAAYGDKRGMIGALVLTVVGFILCIAGGKSSGERNGYHF